MFSAFSYAEWTQIGEDEDERIYYVDYQRIRKEEGYVYWWRLVDNLKPNKSKYLSFKSYSQGDCDLLRIKHLKFFLYPQRMGKGISENKNPVDPQWETPFTDSIDEEVMKVVCNR
jgi:hypothetical protein